MTLKEGLLYGAVGLALFVGFWALTKEGDVIEPIRETPPLGSSSGPSVINGCMDVDGVTRCYTRRELTVSTTTPCAIQTPAATSTLDTGAVRATISSTTAGTFTIAKAATPYATTTIIGNQYTIAGNA